MAAFLFASIPLGKAERMLTLKMLRESVDMPSEGGKVPTWKELREIKPVVCLRENGMSELAVYQSGYVLYRIEKRYTVFPIDLKSSYMYAPSMIGKNAEYESSRIPKECFDNLEWYLPLTLIGEDRLQHNQTIREKDRCISEEDMPDVDIYLGKKNYFVSKMEEEYVLHEEVGGMIESLNERQKTVVHHVYWDEETHMETARKMGYRSTSAVTNVVGRALKKMRKEAGDGDSE